MKLRRGDAEAGVRGRGEGVHSGTMGKLSGETYVVVKQAARQCGEVGQPVSLGGVLERAHERLCR